MQANLFFKSYSCVIIIECYQMSSYEDFFFSVILFTLDCYDLMELYFQYNIIGTFC